MLDFTEAVTIDAPQAAVWELMRDLERWWPESNPDHEHMECLDDGDLRAGSRVRIKEKIAGISGEAIGTITQFEPGRVVTWDAPRACYRLLGLALTVSEGVTWRIEPSGESTTVVSAHVWATVPPGRRGRVAAAVFTRLLGGAEKDRRHARTELQYLKRVLETDG